MSNTTARFDVTKFETAAYDTPNEGPDLARGQVDKEFSTGFVGTGTGEALFCGMGSPADGAGYVVSERLVGSLDGRDGSFVIQHGGVMGAGTPPSTYGTIIPGSGTGELAGISGSIEIERTAEGEHFMHFSWELSA